MVVFCLSFLSSVSLLSSFSTLSLSLSLPRSLYSHLLQPHPVSSHRLPVLVRLAGARLGRGRGPFPQLAGDRPQLGVEELGLFPAAVGEDARDGGADEGDRLFVFVVFVVCFLGCEEEERWRRRVSLLLPKVGGRGRG